MKQILFISLLILGLWACNDDGDRITVTDLPENAFTFKPVTGGAVMHYVLPSDPDIVGVKVRYRNTFGVETLQEGSSSCDSLTLIGFSEARNDIPARVTLSYYNGRESQPFDVMFSTSDSGPVAFMKSVGCYPNWEGFSLNYHVPEGANGIVHVFYVGTNPVTNLPDTLLINSFFLEETQQEGGATSYKMKQNIADPTVVVKVEDFLGYTVGEKIWENVENMSSKKLDAKNFDFYCDNSQEDLEYKLGVEYLFDGDTRGVVCFEDKKFHSFLAGPDAAGENAHPMYIDLRENRLTASVRLYNLYKNSAGLSWYNKGKAGLCNTYNENELPCEVTIYGLKDNGMTPFSYDELDALEGWVKIGSFKEDKGLAVADRWCKNTWHSTNWTQGLDLAELKEAEDEYMEIVIPAFGQGEGYRYLKMVINEVFNYSGNGTSYINTGKYVQFHELEVYTNKD